MRYSNTNTKKLDSGKTASETTLLSKFKERPTDVYLVIVERTRLDHLSHKFYDNPSYWWIIALSNDIKGTMYVQPGTKIRLPANINEAMVDHSKINNR